MAAPTSPAGRSIALANGEPSTHGLIPAPIEVLRYDPELDDEVAGEVLGFDLAALLAPEAEEGCFVTAHDGPRLRATDE